MSVIASSAVFERTGEQVSLAAAKVESCVLLQEVDVQFNFSS